MQPVPLLTLLFGAYLAADGTWPVVMIYQQLTGDMHYALEQPWRVVPALALKLAVAVVWILGWRRTALVLFLAALLLPGLPRDILSSVRLIDLGAVLVLIAAAVWRWPAARSMRWQLAALPLVAVGWVVADVLGRKIFPAGPPGWGLIAATAVTGAVVVAAVLIRRRRSPVAVAAWSLLGFLYGAAMPTVLELRIPVFSWSQYLYAALPAILLPLLRRNREPATAVTVGARADRMGN